MHPTPLTPTLTPACPEPHPNINPNPSPSPEPQPSEPHQAFRDKKDRLFNEFVKGLTQVVSSSISK